MPVESNQSPHHFPVPPASALPLIPPIGQRLNGNGLKHHLQTIRRRQWLVIGVAIAVTALSWGYTLTRTPTYRGEFRVLVESPLDGDRSRQLLQPDQPLEAIDDRTQLEVLRSPSLLEPIAVALRQQYPDLTAEHLSQHLSIQRLRNTRILSIRYRDPNPERLREVLEEVAQYYLRYSFQQRQSNLLQGVQFVDDQLPDLRKRVNTLQIRLERFRKDYRLIDPTTRGEDLTALLTELEVSRQQTAAQLKETQALYRSLQRQVGLNPTEALASSALSESMRYQMLLNQVREIETLIAMESARPWPGGLPIMALEAQRRTLLPLVRQEAQRVLKRLADARSPRLNDSLTPTTIEISRRLVDTANQVSVLETRSDALLEAEERLKEEFSIVPSLAREYADLQRELSIASTSLNRLLSARETLQLEAAQNSVPWELLSAPMVSSRPVPIIPQALVLGAIAGLLSGVGVALLIDHLDTVLRSPDDLKDATILPLLGTIPHLPTAPVDPSDGLPVSSLARLQDALLPSATPPGNASDVDLTASLIESLYSLYVNVRFLSSDAPIRSVVVSSAAPTEGKSTLSLHLAKTVASLGQRVLLVDANLRHPQIHEYLGISNLKGLSNAIAIPLPLREVVQRSPLYPSLYVLPAGAIPPDPVRLLSSQRMRMLMEQVPRQFDLVIYDAPPLLGLADSHLLTAQADGLLLVVGLGQTDRIALTQAIATLPSTSILGVVANYLRPQPHGYRRDPDRRYRRYDAQQSSHRQ